MSSSHIMNTDATDAIQFTEPHEYEYVEYQCEFINPDIRNDATVPDVLKLDAGSVRSVRSYNTRLGAKQKQKKRTDARARGT